MFRYDIRKVCDADPKHGGFVGGYLSVITRPNTTQKEIKTPRLILVRKRVSEKVNMIDVNRVFKSIILCQMLRKVYCNL